MQAFVEWQNVTFTYKHASQPSVDQFSLQVAAGDFVLITGSTGCGKSTLLKMLNGLIPEESGGVLCGTVLVNRQDTRQLSVTQLSRTVGMVFQSPEDQIFSTTVYDETAFVLENMGMAAADINHRVDEALALVGLLNKREASVHALSGGQKQRLAVASVLAARPAILALDEPISQLDPRGATELLAVLEKINRELGITIILVEHRLHEVMPLCNRVVVMDAGKLLWEGTRAAAFGCPELFAGHGLRVPQPVDICRRLGLVSSSAGVEEAVAAIRRRYHVPAVAGTACIPAATGSGSEPAMEIQNLSFWYEQSPQPVLDHIDLFIPRGQFVALMGNNGAGKSTLLQQIGGLLTPRQGTVRVLGQPLAAVRRQVGMVLQNPDLMLFNSTVAEEVAFAPRQQQAGNGLTPYCRELILKMGLNGREEEFPLALSRGQRLRLALAAVLSCRPAVLLLDEPTTGQDIGHIEDIIVLLKEYVVQGGTVVFCTHDTEVAAGHADRVIVLCQGRLTADGPPAVVFNQDAMLRRAGLKPPAALLVARQLYGGVAMGVEEVVRYVRQGCLGSNAG
ncbi:ABC transporter ATP-binding protein [Sporomusa termitida]|uniref:HMP/thiamine import ATP-binding protein YkoD n=1 Tax=Sporomusa termitida TaxID=2377 RepID=A0A517DP08_9FIRM|nr:ABC transporter ATP-binding protein [Sporomusa termitida]QDR79103.1 Putative HMP/thiamine import ATP-binding protein YkoD [Sporomusa termitida]